MHFKVNLVLFCSRCTLRNIEKSMLVLTFCTRMWQSENELMSARAANLYRNPNGGKEFLMQFRICAWFTRICFVHAQNDCGHANEIDTTISVFFLFCFNMPFGCPFFKSGWQSITAWDKTSFSTHNCEYDHSAHGTHTHTFYALI